MIGSIAPKELTWLTRFFSGENRLHWHEIETSLAPPEYLDQVMPWLKSWTSELVDCPIVLPIYGKDGPVCWYAMASDDRQFFQLKDEIVSFVGPSFSEFNGAVEGVEGKAEHEIALKKRFGNRVIVFRPNGSHGREEIEKALLLYQSLLIRRPDVPDRTQRPFGKIRGDFDRAILAGNETHAQAFFDELCLSGRINAEQRKCLEVRLLAGLGRTEELAKNQALISSVSDLSLPHQTLIDIIEALYQVYILPIEETSNLEEILKIFKRSISIPFGMLFKDGKGIRRPIVLRSFLLYEIAKDFPSITLFDSILDVYPKNIKGYDVLYRWRKWLIVKSGIDVITDECKITIESARSAIADEEYGLALDLCLGLIPDYWAYSTLIRCAIELNKVEVTDKVLAIVDSAAHDIKGNFTDKDNARLKMLHGSRKLLLDGDSGWIAWAKGVERENDRKGSMLSLKENIARWSVDEYASDVEGCKCLAQLIGNASGDAESIYRDAFPSLVDFFVEGIDRPCRAFVPLYGTLIKVVGWSGALTADELEIVYSLTQALLATGPSRQDYSECLKDLREIVRANISPVNLDWALNLSEILVGYPSQDDFELGLDVFMEIISKVEVISHRTTEAQRSILRFLGRDYGCHEFIESLTASISTDISSQESASFSGLIGIYSLMESAGQRAKAFLGEIFPNARIEINHDEVATDKLTALAKNADHFVFAWKSGKHQAYGCVKNARGQKDIIMPPGKGSASIISSLLERVQSLPL